MFVLLGRPHPIYSQSRGNRPASPPCIPRACAAGSERGALTETPVPPLLSLPRHGKPDQQRAQGLCPAPASAEGVQLLPEQRKGLDFTGCVICDSARCLGDRSEPRPGSAIPSLPGRNAPADIEGKLLNFCTALLPIAGERGGVGKRESLRQALLWCSGLFQLQGNFRELQLFLVSFFFLKPKRLSLFFFLSMKSPMQIVKVCSRWWAFKHAERCGREHFASFDTETGLYNCEDIMFPAAVLDKRNLKMLCVKWHCWGKVLPRASA